MRHSISIVCNAFSMITISSFTAASKGGVNTNSGKYSSEMKAQDVIPEDSDCHKQNKPAAIERESMAENMLQSAWRENGLSPVTKWTLSCDQGRNESNQDYNLPSV
ncbi:hypothetical protein AVEN_124979-1 [Araneus ventricosus]|uniref:Uncharacterized protein n=1 Tax=Araneus ventricosus TaxID=182803 RepID=A0A4Y2EFR5_ARAVE|nr:hypothetical protein AVEN_124979-1 [Araneus ventricosus]